MTVEGGVIPLNLREIAALIYCSQALLKGSGAKEFLENEVNDDEREDFREMLSDVESASSKLLEIIKNVNPNVH